MKRSNPEIRIADTWEKSKERFAKGALVEIRSGKGTLRRVYGQKGETIYSTLMLGEQPLFQMQAEEYWCPTCEKILRSGYGLKQTEEFFQNPLNENVDNRSVTELILGISPILGLLKSGYFAVVDTQLYPTDGHGHLFCDVPDSGEYLSGTCTYYYGNCRWGNDRPYFTIATEPPGKLEEGRVRDYMEHPRGKALAYYMEGYMTALLDGHHKAMAAAKLHKKLDALVIIPCYKYRRRIEEGSYEAYGGTDKVTYEKYISVGEMHWNCREYGLDWDLDKDGTLDRLGEAETERIQEKIQEGQKLILPHGGAEGEQASEDFCKLASYYPTVDDVAALDLVRDKIAPEHADLQNLNLEQLNLEQINLDEEEVEYFIRAMAVLRYPGMLEAAEFLLHQERYCRERYGILKELTRLPRTEELADWMLKIMLEFEDDYPEIKNLILDYI